jgi:hypothetical protein
MTGYADIHNDSLWGCVRVESDPHLLKIICSPYSNEYSTSRPARSDVRDRNCQQCRLAVQPGISLR